MNSAGREPGIYVPASNSVSNSPPPGRGIGSSNFRCLAFVSQSGEEVGAGGGELHVGSGFMQFQPAPCDGKI